MPKSCHITQFLLRMAGSGNCVARVFCCWWWCCNSRRTMDRLSVKDCPLFTAQSIAGRPPRSLAAAWIAVSRR
ncbi:hypothetical protein L207DRAFT_15347 [Hyaloscypha variabilis F]|uniref:Uncharacterized protein n=1 Tax=Hyaloscypha variabilis (strain UAMH 11265 / GT02V1 / F) TaxID=1149755 RepID=A0A2J6SD85_HYAVF|nr:hypothetical protein L207DRAFT_15347 [Hyaloscypha variabilis F]